MAELIAPVADRLGELEQLCRRHRVQRLDLFGSATTGRYRREGSDLDFLVEFQPTDTPGGRADAYFGMLEGLEELFQCPIDLVVASAIRNPYFLESVEESRTLIYAASPPSPRCLDTSTPPHPLTPHLSPFFRAPRLAANLIDIAPSPPYPSLRSAQHPTTKVHPCRYKPTSS